MHLARRTGVAKMSKVPIAGQGRVTADMFERQSPPSAKSALGFLANSNEALLKSGKYHDFVLNCKGTEFRVHRSIICSKSPVLDALCSSPFKVRTLQPGLVKTVLTAASRRATKAVLPFMI